MMWDVIAAPLAGFLAALVVTWAAQHNFTLSQEQVTALFLGVFGSVKHLVGRYTNPGNVTAPELVDEPKAQARSARAMKAARRTGGV